MSWEYIMGSRCDNRDCAGDTYYGGKRRVWMEVRDEGKPSAYAVILCEACYLEKKRAEENGEPSRVEVKDAPELKAIERKKRRSRETRKRTT